MDSAKNKEELTPIILKFFQTTEEEETPHNFSCEASTPIQKPDFTTAREVMAEPHPGNTDMKVLCAKRRGTEHSHITRAVHGDPVGPTPRAQCWENPQNQLRQHTSQWNKDTIASIDTGKNGEKAAQLRKKTPSRPAQGDPAAAISTPTSSTTPVARDQTHPPHTAAQGGPLCPEPLHSVVLAAPARALRQEKEMKTIQNKKEEIKLYLSAYDVTLVLKGPKIQEQ